MDIIEECKKLREDLDLFNQDFVQARNNKSANRRARGKSVQIRETLKNIRKKLILIEKGIL